MEFIKLEGRITVVSDSVYIAGVSVGERIVNKFFDYSTTIIP